MPEHTRSVTEEKGKHLKGKSITEVLSVFILFEIIIVIYKSTEFKKMEINSLGWSYIGGSLMIVIPLFILFLTKRNFKSYGITCGEWRETLDIGMTFVFIRTVKMGIIFALVWIVGRNLLTHFIQAGIGIVFLFLLLIVLQKRGSSRPNTALNGVIFVLLLSFPLLLGIFLNRLTYVVVSTVVWQVLFSGVGEEILYRGYFQSRINEGFGRPFSFLGVEFGIGVVVSSLLFAFAHILNPFNPFAHEYVLDWWWGFISFFEGLTFAFVREKTKSIVPGALAHGLVDAVGEGSMQLLLS